MQSLAITVNFPGSWNTAPFLNQHKVDFNLLEHIHKADRALNSATVFSASPPNTVPPAPSSSGV